MSFTLLICCKVIGAKVPSILLIVVISVAKVILSCVSAKFYQPSAQDFQRNVEMIEHSWTSQAAKPSGPLNIENKNIVNESNNGWFLCVYLRSKTIAKTSLLIY
jgi:hypothetical protein